MKRFIYGIRNKNDMSEVLWNLMDILCKRRHVEYHDSLNAINVVRENDLEVSGLRPA